MKNRIENHPIIVIIKRFGTTEIIKKLSIFGELRKNRVGRPGLCVCLCMLEAT